MAFPDDKNIYGVDSTGSPTIIDEKTKSVDFKDKDIHSIEIGDTKDSTQFFPQAKILQWDNETNFSLRLLVDPDGSEYYLDEEERLKWITSNEEIEVDIYSLDESNDLEHGGLEFETLFHSKPLSNIINYTIRSKGLNFFYQPELSDEHAQKQLDRMIDSDSTAYSDWTLEDVKRHLRPENVVGSYAVYHKSEKDNNYRAGKAFHIYRPHVTDKAGTRVWCDLDIDVDKEILRITIPQKFLENAIYPIRLDPTLGYTSIGGSLFNWGNNDALGLTVTPSVDLDVDDIVVYIDATKKNGDFRGVMWLYSTGAVLTDGFTPAHGLITGPVTAWYTATYVTKPSLTSGTF